MKARRRWSGLAIYDTPAHTAECLSSNELNDIANATELRMTVGIGLGGRQPNDAELRAEYERLNRYRKDAHNLRTETEQKHQVRRAASRSRNRQSQDAEFWEPWQAMHDRLVSEGREREAISIVQHPLRTAADPGP